MSKHNDSTQMRQVLCPDMLLQSDEEGASGGGLAQGGRSPTRDGGQQGGKSPQWDKGEANRAGFPQGGQSSTRDSWQQGNKMTQPDDGRSWFPQSSMSPPGDSWEQGSKLTQQDEGRSRFPRGGQSSTRDSWEQGSKLTQQDDGRSRFPQSSMSPPGDGWQQGSKSSQWDGEEFITGGLSQDRSPHRNRPTTGACRECGAQGCCGKESGSREMLESSYCTLDELKRLSQLKSHLGPLSFSKNHTVLVDVQSFNTRNEIQPQGDRVIWQSNVVKMPHAKQNIITTRNAVHMQRQTLKWDAISKSLKGLAKKKSVDVKDVEEAIIKYNPVYKERWSFDALHTFVKCISTTENYIYTLFPKMAALALELPDHVKKAIPLLQRGRNAAITLSQVQISCLLANAFFCTFPHRNTSGANAEYDGYPSINFSSLFGGSSHRKNEKLRAIMHYFFEVTNADTRPVGMVTFERCCLQEAEFPHWKRSGKTMPKLFVSSSGTIETNGTGMLQVDFACSSIGGGILGSGLVQEEILFLMHPELIVSRLFTEKLADNECLLVTGSQQFSCYFGFGDSFQWGGPNRDNLKRDRWARLQRKIVAIDALKYRHQADQYKMGLITRELNKAYCGFKARGPDEPDIATGKWGCGAFGGDPQLKAVIQLMAAAEAGKGMAFFTFMDEDLEKDLQQIHHLLVTGRMTVGALYLLLEDFYSHPRSSGTSNPDLFAYIRREIRHRQSLL